MTDTAMINDGHVHLGMTVRDSVHRHDEGLLLAEMDRYGVARAAVITPAVCGWDNGLTVAAVRTHPDRFVGVARIDMHRSSAPQVCAGLLDEGLHGIRIDVRGSGDILETTTSTEVLAVLRERHAVLNLHASAVEITTVARIADRHPDLTVLLDHGGRPTPADLDNPSGSALTPLLDQANVVVKTPNASAFSAARPPYEDLAPFHAWLAEALGADRVMWGSDWPVCPDDSAYGGAVAAASAAFADIAATESTSIFRDTFDMVFGAAVSTSAVSDGGGVIPR